MTAGRFDSTAPLVSVCIPVYNGKTYLEETILSVLAQDYPNFEILVQDNASHDGTWECLHGLAESHPRISIERNETNVGMAPNWNLAINRARGEYVMLLSADDLLEPGFLNHCMTVFLSEAVDVVTTNFYWLNNNIKKLGKTRIRKGIHVDFWQVLLRKNPFSINFSIFSRKTVEQMRERGNLFAVKYLSCDFDLWLRLALHGKRVYYLSEPLGTYRVHEGNLSRQLIRMYRHATLVLLRHKRELRPVCGMLYKYTLLRLIKRNLKHWLQYGVHDRRHTRILWGEFCRREKLRGLRCGC